MKKVCFKTYIASYAPEELKELKAARKKVEELQADIIEKYKGSEQFEMAVTFTNNSLGAQHRRVDVKIVDSLLSVELVLDVQDEPTDQSSGQPTNQPPTPGPNPPDWIPASCLDLGIPIMRPIPSHTEVVGAVYAPPPVMPEPPACTCKDAATPYKPMRLSIDEAVEHLLNGRKVRKRYWLRDLFAVMSPENAPYHDRVLLKDRHGVRMIEWTLREFREIGGVWDIAED